MAYILTDVGVYVGGFDLSNGAADIDMGGTCTMQEKTNFGSKQHSEFLPGLKTYNTQVGGLADYGSVTAVSNAFALNSVGDQHVVTALPNVSGTHAAGDPAHFTRALRSMFQTPQGAVGDVARYAMALQSDTAMVENGKLLFPKAVVTSSSSGSVVAMTGPTASQYLFAGLHIFDVSGTSPTLDVKIQSAALVGFGSPTDRVTFTQATGSSDNTSQWATPVAGAITDGFWRVTYTVGGSTPSFQFAVVAGVLTVT